MDTWVYLYIQYMYRSVVLLSGQIQVDDMPMLVILFNV